MCRVGKVIYKKKCENISSFLFKFFESLKIWKLSTLADKVRVKNLLDFKEMLTVSWKTDGKIFF